MIEEANQIDLETIKEIGKDIFSSEINLNAFSKIYVYKENKMLGFLALSIMYERAEIDYIYVLEDYRKKKIASKLLDKMFIDFKNNNVKSVSLEVMIDNIQAIKLYKKYSFKEVAIRKNYYQEKDAYLMVREVD